MHKNPSTIIGAGLAGLIAAHAWPTARLIERSPEPVAGHKALLRFRSDAVARLTGIPFRKVRVRKGIWSNGTFAEPSILIANRYSLKCTGRLLAERSIWKLETVDRFIAPDDFHSMLLDSVGMRVEWDSQVTFMSDGIFGDAFPFNGPVVNTSPLPLAASMLGDVLHDGERPEFARSGIRVQRFDLGRSVDLYQTIYFPDLHCSVYRASITGRTLIVEFVDGTTDANASAGLGAVEDAFGISVFSEAPAEDVQQKFGKIVPIDDEVRKHLLFRLSHEHSIYSLGRFATWRNILLDDVVQDIEVIKRLIRSGPYERRHAA